MTKQSNMKRANACAKRQNASSEYHRRVNDQFSDVIDNCQHLLSSLVLSPPQSHAHCVTFVDLLVGLLGNAYPASVYQQRQRIPIDWFNQTMYHVPNNLFLGRSIDSTVWLYRLIQYYRYKLSDFSRPYFGYIGETDKTLSCISHRIIINIRPI